MTTTSRRQKWGMAKIISWGALAGLLVFGAAGCGPTKYLTFEVWEGPGQSSHAKKLFIGGIGGYHEQAWAALQKNDVDGAIKLIEQDQMKNDMDYYNLAILYEVKHDWAKAENAIQQAIKIHNDKFHQPDKRYEAELRYIQDHKARYVYTPPAK